MDSSLHRMYLLEQALNAIAKARHSTAHTYIELVNSDGAPGGLVDIYLELGRLNDWLRDIIKDEQDD